MGSVRCLIADMPQMVLADIVRNLAEECSDIEVVGRVNSLEDVLTATGHDPVDVLITGMQNTALPHMYLDIMKKITNLAVVGLVDDGRQLAVYLDNVGKNDILKILRVLRRSNREQMF